MKAYNPKFVDVVRQVRRWPFRDQQRQSVSRVDRTKKLNADLVACLDRERRLSYLSQLKAQIDAGTYYIDNHSLALKMLQLEQNNVFRIKREEA